MPKRTTASPDPPLQKGLACARCKARKVRCSGGPGPCASCLRTARFRGHRVEDATCAYNGEGRCSEDQASSGNVKEPRKPRQHAHEKAPSYRPTQFALESGPVAMNDTTPFTPFNPIPIKPTTTLTLLPQLRDIYNSQGGTLFALPPLAPPVATATPATISARRAGGLSMKIDLSPSTFTFPSVLSRTAPLETPRDWAPSRPPLVYGSSASSSSHHTASPEQSIVQSRDDFYLSPYPSPSILPANIHGTPTFALPTTPFQSVPFTRSASGGSISLAPTPSYGTWESPGWQPRTDYWMDMSLQ